jgi:hypothetical protein
MGGILLGKTIIKQIGEGYLPQVSAKVLFVGL